MTHIMSTETPMVPRKEAAERLKLALPTLDLYARTGLLPRVREGRNVYFAERDVRAFELRRRAAEDFEHMASIIRKHVRRDLQERLPCMNTEDKDHVADFAALMHMAASYLNTGIVGAEEAPRAARMAWKLLAATHDLSDINKMAGALAEDIAIAVQKVIERKFPGVLPEGYSPEFRAPQP